MRKLALVLTILPVLAACQNFGWEGAGANVSAEQRARGIKDVHALASAQETESYYQGVRRRSDGLNNAFARDLDSILTFWDRHFMNYDRDDPYVNYPSDTTRLEHLGRFGLSTVATLPVIEDVTRK